MMIDFHFEVPATSRGQLGRMVSFWFGKWWWTIALPVGIIISLAVCVDVRWWYVAMMVILMAYPSVLWIVYTHYGSMPDSRLALWAKEIDITHQGISIIYKHPIYENMETDDADDTRIIGYDTVAKQIEADRISDYSVDATGVTILWGRGAWDYVMIPHNVFSSLQQSKQLIQWLDSIIVGPTR